MAAASSLYKNISTIAEMIGINATGKRTSAPSAKQNSRRIVMRHQFLDQLDFVSIHTEVYMHTPEQIVNA